MNWTCPYCGNDTTITPPNIDEEWTLIDIAKEHITYAGMAGIRYLVIACPNKVCKRLFLSVKLKKALQDPRYNWVETGTVFNEWQLLPESTAKPQPEYIPKQIIQDYAEACRIKDLSPKASATLARRCLQGMIRDFWDIKVDSAKLYDEITELEGKVSSTEWEAIDALRSVGNVGAHMKQDVNVIIDVGPDEAGLLIEFIEGLFKDWYVARRDKNERNLRLKELARNKGEKPRASKASNG